MSRRCLATIRFQVRNRIIMYCLTKSGHFILFRLTCLRRVLGELYLEHVIKLHGVLLKIFSDYDKQFNAKYWKSLQKLMDTELNFSTAFHPQTDGQLERTIQILEDLLRSCVLDWQGSWEDHLPLVEFAYNNSYQSTIGMAPIEALYGRPCRSPSCWLDTRDPVLIGAELIEETVKHVELIKKRMKEAQDRQKSYADIHKRTIEFEVGEHVFLKISPTKGVMRFGKSGKLSPRYVGPFEILKRVGAVACQLALPPTLTSAHDVFHVSMLKKYVSDASHKIDFKDLKIQEDMSYIEKPLKILDTKVKVLRTKTILLVKVLWKNHTLEETTWEVEQDMKSKYPELFPQANFGVKFL